MSQQNTLILLCCVLLLALAGCKKGKQYPTAQAPPTIKDPPPRPMNVAGQDDDDDDDLDDDDDGEDDDGEDDDDNAPRTARSRHRNLSMGRASMSAMNPARPPVAMVRTINGHPGGPKAEVFNAVTSNAMPNAAPCFAQAVSGGRTVSVVVRMTVGNSGAVQEAKAVSGDQNPTLRKCLCGVVKRLTFPAFKGPKVTKSVPFTAVGGISKP